MDHIIKQILQIDAAAKQKLEEARQKREEMMAEIDSEAAAEAGKLRQHSEEKIEMVRQTEAAAAEDEIQRIRQAADAQIAALEKQFAEKGPEWLEGIAREVTGA